MMRRSSICFFINLFVCLSAFSQDTSHTNSKINPSHMYTSLQVSALNSVFLSAKNCVLPGTTTTVKTIPAYFYPTTIGFFCQKELQIEKTLKMPVKFRLGSVEYTDKMEGKGKATLLTDR